jgi:hypothetical protein
MKRRTRQPEREHRRETADAGQVEAAEPVCGTAGWALDQQAVATWREQIDAMMEALQQQVAAFRAQISEGGAFRAELAAQVAAFQAAADSVTRALAAWDGNLELDAGAAVAWLLSVAEAARGAAAQTLAGENSYPWPQILRETAQPAVDAWRGRYGADVEAQYHPPVPRWEIDACRALHDEALADPVIRDPSGIEVAWQACAAFEGQEGREALYGLWDAEEDLVAAVQAARA